MRGRNIVRAIHERDPTMSQTQEMFGQLARTRDIIALDRVGHNIVDRAVEQHELGSLPREKVERFTRAVAGWCDQEPIDAVLEHDVDILPLLVDRPVAVPEQDSVAVALSHALDTRHNLSEERVT